MKLNTIVISLINDFILGKNFVIEKDPFKVHENLSEIEKKIIKILDQKLDLQLLKMAETFNLKNLRMES